MWEIRYGVEDALNQRDAQIRDIHNGFAQTSETGSKNRRTTRQIRRQISHPQEEKVSYPKSHPEAQTLESNSSYIKTNVVRQMTEKR